MYSVVWTKLPADASRADSELEARKRAYIKSQAPPTNSEEEEVEDDEADAAAQFRPAEPAAAAPANP